MSTYTATITWALRDGEDFAKRRYSRAHTLSFDGGLTAPASASPSVVPEPFSDPAGVDPEEMLIAALSSCHMLSFLDLAARAGWVVERYDDRAEGVMSRLERGRFAVTRVTLRPEIAFRGAAPDAAALGELHHQAHELCFIANSVKTEVVVEPRSSLPPA